MSTTYPTSVLTIYSPSSATIPYAGITNNTLGGYLISNPYASHNWTINGVSSATNPGINITASTSAVAISATRTTTGESELLLAFKRTIVDAPEIPLYTLSTTITQTAGNQIGNGYINGAGSYPAGTIVPVFAVATYGSFGRGGMNTNVFLLSGIGSVNNWVSGPTGSLNYNVTDKGGRYDGSVFMDSNRSIDAAFYHS
jgi:hypothetical protein